MIVENGNTCSGNSKKLPDSTVTQNDRWIYINYVYLHCLILISSFYMHYEHKIPACRLIHQQFLLILCLIQDNLPQIGFGL